MNALASSIVLVCRQRPTDAPMATRREFVAALRAELPTALAHLQSGNIAPVDLAQAAIGPGMAVFTRYAKVLDAEGNPVSVREALALINQMLDEVLAEQEGDFDPDSRWALAWFEQQGFDEGEYGVAETLSKAKNTSIAGIVEGGILASSAGKVRLLRPDELADDWDPASDNSAHRVGSRPPSHPRPRNRRRTRSSAGRGPPRRIRRHRPRTSLPPLHHLRTQAPRRRSPFLQQPSTELARNLRSSAKGTAGEHHSKQGVSCSAIELWEVQDE